MFESGGTIYVYLSYGIHRCLNFVTGPKGEGGAVLIRSIVELRSATGDDTVYEELTLGPGRVGRRLGVDLEWSGSDLFSDDAHLRVFERSDEIRVASSTRIGISKATEIEWRFYDSSFLRLGGRVSR